MSTPAIKLDTDHAVDVLDQALTAYPCHIPFAVQQSTRDSIAAWRAGDRTPEVTLCLAIAFSSYNDNALRHRVYQAALGLANGFAA